MLAYEPEEGNRSSLHCAPSDFPFRPVALMHCMRLSEKKHPSINSKARDKQKLRGKGFEGRAVVSHISRKTSEMWGTRALVVKEKKKTKL